MVRATKLAERNLDRVRKEQKLNVSPPHMNRQVKGDDIQDEGMLFNWDCASSPVKRHMAEAKKKAVKTVSTSTTPFFLI